MLLLDIQCHENDAIYIFQNCDKMFENENLKKY
jgi:hypothetical protein